MLRKRLRNDEDGADDEELIEGGKSKRPGKKEKELKISEMDDWMDSDDDESDTDEEENKKGSDDEDAKDAKKKKKGKGNKEITKLPFTIAMECFKMLICVNKSVQ